MAEMGCLFLSWRQDWQPCLFGILLWCAASCPAMAGDPLPATGTTYSARDTLDCGSDTSADAQECLETLRWAPGEFSVRCDPSPLGMGDLLVRFPSPRDTQDPVRDSVAMEWYVARDPERNLRVAPAIVIVHESGSGMKVGKMIARGLHGLKFHAFLIQLPGYGVRKSGQNEDVAETFAILKQGIADVRRARDAVAALPGIDTTKIGLQGTSLGGFVAATVAGMDRAYDRIFILLAGGNLHDVIEQGAHDTAHLREKLKAAGIEGAQLRARTRAIEPLRIAHRIDPQTTWLYSGKLDDVVPPACSKALAQTAGLPAGHHIELPVDHYSGIVLLPKILLEIRQAMTHSEDDQAAPNTAIPGNPDSP